MQLLPVPQGVQQGHEGGQVDQGPDDEHVLDQRKEEGQHIQFLVRELAGLRTERGRWGGGGEGNGRWRATRTPPPPLSALGSTEISFRERGARAPKSKNLCTQNSQINISFCKIELFPTMKSVQFSDFHSSTASVCLVTRGTGVGVGVRGTGRMGLRGYSQ